MSATYFAQECPSCGRHLRIRVEYLGKHVACQHCDKHFEARMEARPSDSGEYLLTRANELLACVESSTRPLEL